MRLLAWRLCLAGVLLSSCRPPQEQSLAVDAALPVSPPPRDLALPPLALLENTPHIKAPQEIFPGVLSATGLYADIGQKRLTPTVLPFEPRYQLWADGADKSRFILLPQGEKIDTTSMDRWRFPVGTKIWKEFRKDGKRLETRLQWKRKDPSDTYDAWSMVTYVWDDDEREARRAPNGQLHVRGTDHDVPTEMDCTRCHRVENERPIGFSAILLSGARNGVDLRYLAEHDLLTVPPAGSYVVPGVPAQRDALGYLHANCSGCHAADSKVFETVPMSLRLEVGALAAVNATATYLTTVGQQTVSTKQGENGLIRIIAGDPDNSALYRRMGIRQVSPESIQMPPLGTSAVDTAGRAQIAAFIQGLK